MLMAVLPAGVVTFLFTDIEGSSRLWEQYPDPMRTALEWHDTLLREAIEGRGGHIFKTVGDGVCAVFPGADAALAAAHDAQQELHSLSASEFGTLKVRMALLTGHAHLRDNDYFGASVNRTARLCAIGHGGQILLAQVTASLLSPAVLSALNEATLRDMGLHRLKDLRDAEHVYQFIHPALPADFPPLRSLDRFTHNLPSQLTTLIGRDADVAHALRLLTGKQEKGVQGTGSGEQGTENTGVTSGNIPNNKQQATNNKQLSPASARLLTLTGTGGCGKTRLALQIGAELLDEYGDGVWFADLAALTDAELLPQIIAQALGENVEQTGRSAQDTLIELLKSRALLLILDNCEHLVEGCAHLADALLRACPNLRILATSRENLDIAGETTLRVAPLPAPAQGKSAAPDDLMRYASAHLFVERAQAALPSWMLTPQNAAAVAQVCCQMDGIPLALELAARRVKSMTVEAIARQLSDSLSRFAGSRTDPPRQQTLDAVIGWSYDLLTDAECVLLRRLSVFAGGWTLDSAEAIGADEEEGEAQTLSSYDVPDVLMRLVDKSLVVFEEVEAGESRYRLLETIRQYSVKRLEQSGELNTLRERHLAWYLELAEQAEAHLQGAEQAAWLNRLEREHDNLRAALKWTADVEIRLRLASALWRFWYTRGHLTEGRGWLEGTLERSQNVAPALRAKALNAAGILVWRQGDCETAQRWYEQSLAIYRKLNDKLGEAKTLNNLGLVAYNQEDFVLMRSHLEQCLPLYMELREEASAARVLNNLGMAATALHEYGEARKFLHDSLSLSQKLGIKSCMAGALSNLGEAACAYKDYSGADDFYRRSLHIQYELADQQEMSVAVQGLGVSAMFQGEDKRAVSLLAAAETLRSILFTRLVASDYEQHEQIVQSLRQRLGETAFDAAWKRGTAFEMDALLNFV